ncbi:MAG TPA: hypothetical protein DDY98_01605, partial [Ruminococcaceae bacterium]|nr:hypothetical protein [Oscillospiraceae bacterium]
PASSAILPISTTNGLPAISVLNVLKSSKVLKVISLPLSFFILGNGLLAINKGFQPQCSKALFTAKAVLPDFAF